MPKNKTNNKLFLSKLLCLVTLKILVRRESIREHFGLSLSSYFDKNPYFFEIFNSKIWWENFSALDKFPNKIEIGGWYDDISANEEFTTEEITVVNLMFGELIQKLRIPNSYLKKFNSKFTFWDILSLSGEILDEDKKVIAGLVNKYKVMSASLGENNE